MRMSVTIRHLSSHQVYLALRSDCVGAPIMGLVNELQKK